MAVLCGNRGNIKVEFDAAGHRSALDMARNIATHSVWDRSLLFAGTTIDVTCTYIGSLKANHPITSPTEQGMADESLEG